MQRSFATKYTNWKNEVIYFNILSKIQLLRHNYIVKSDLISILFFWFRREIFKEHQWVFAPNSNCMMKSMMKLVLDEMMKRCIQNDMLPPFIIVQATSNMKSVTFDEVNSSKCPECCRKLAKILPFAQLVFCWYLLTSKIIG